MRKMVVVFALVGCSGSAAPTVNCHPKSYRACVCHVVFAGDVCAPSGLCSTGLTAADGKEIDNAECMGGDSVDGCYPDEHLRCYGGGECNANGLGTCT